MEDQNPIGAIFRIINEGGMTMYAIVTCSVVLLGLVIERFYFFWKMGLDYEWMLMQMAYFIENKQIPEAIHFCRQISGSLARVFETGLLRAGKPRQEIEEAMNSTISEEILGFDKNLSYVGTLAVIAPFIGLLGTVLGIMRAFADIALKGATGPAVVAKGVAEALTATAAGLYVAIPASVFFNYFKNRVKTTQQQMRFSGSRLAEMLVLADADEPLPEDLRPSVVMEKTAAKGRHEK
ncbi:MAG: MotA/TolQ/ExbB proton channel family protein [Candidatus Eremiobacteraeota bacterium]|nr:MotA/TolQ/ExbB proton channel family protein [Candidatus Eremiobacteraeota bacterium]